MTQRKTRKARWTVTRCKSSKYWTKPSKKKQHTPGDQIHDTGKEMGKTIAETLFSCLF